GTGGVLRPQDVTCDRLRGFFVGNTLTADTSRQLVDAYVAQQSTVDALVNYESVLLSLNASGRLPANLTIAYPRARIAQPGYPRDRIGRADSPLLLLDPSHREAYDTVTSWLRSPAAQKRIMELTLRRPIDPDVARDERLRAPIGNALYFPDQQAVVDTLLTEY